MGPESGNPEIASQSQLGGVITSGGGFSTYFEYEDWQGEAQLEYADYVILNGMQPAAGYNVYGRGFPDLSLIGVWYQVVIQGYLQPIFGTSASTPVVAAMISLANAARATQGKPPLGFLNPTLWAYGVDNNFGPGGNSSNLYNDITSGINNCLSWGNTSDLVNTPCCEAGFSAIPGWDPVTGFGSLDYTNLLTMFENPVANPTLEPTAQPTTPSCVPTAIPSGTMRPSAAPTAPPSPVVMFSSNITLTGLTSSVLDTASQNAIIATTATAMQVPQSTVTFQGTASVTPAVTVRFLDEMEGTGNGLRTKAKGKVKEGKQVQTTYTVIAVTYTKIALSQTSYSSTSALYSGVTTLLTNAVNNGTYTSSLQSNAVAYNAPVLATATATYASSSPPTVVASSPSSDSSSSTGNTLSAGGIAGVSIACIVVAAIICFVAWYFLSRSSRNKDTTGFAMDKDFGVAATNPVSGDRNYSADRL